MSKKIIQTLALSAFVLGFAQGAASAADSGSDKGQTNPAAEYCEKWHGTYAQEGTKNGMCTLLPDEKDPIDAMEFMNDPKWDTYKSEHGLD